MSMTSSVSIVVPCHNEQPVLPELLDALRQLTANLESCQIDSEVILVDDGSTDGTWSILCQVALPRWRCIRLTRNFGQQAALLCGYRHAHGDAVVSLDADLQDPPALVLELVRRWQQGADIVYAVRTVRHGETWFKRQSARAYYRLASRLLGPFFRRDCADFRLMSRRALSVLFEMRDQRPFLRGMVGWTGLRTDEIHYDRPGRRAGTTKYGIGKMFRLAMDGLISFSDFLLYLPFVMAGVFGFAGFTLLAYGLLWRSHQPPTWIVASLIVAAVMIVGASCCTCLGILGWYVARVFHECRNWPQYVVQETSVGDARTADTAIRRRRVAQRSPS